MPPTTTVSNYNIYHPSLLPRLLHYFLIIKEKNNDPPLIKMRVVFTLSTHIVFINVFSLEAPAIEVSANVTK